MSSFALDEHKEELIELHKKWLKSPLNGWDIRTTEFSWLPEYIVKYGTARAFNAQKLKEVIKQKNL